MLEGAFLHRTQHLHELFFTRVVLDFMYLITVDSGVFELKFNVLVTIFETIYIVYLLFCPFVICSNITSRLGPGEMLSVNLKEGVFRLNNEVKKDAATRRPYGEWADKSIIKLSQQYFERGKLLTALVKNRSKAPFADISSVF